MITLHEHDVKNPTNQGFGSINDAISSVVVEELNGSFELTVTYPITGLRYKDILLRRQFYCKPNPYDNEQLFRIYSISKPINGIVTINASHISYDQSGYPINEFTSSSVEDAIVKLNQNSQLSSPWIFDVDSPHAGNMTVDTIKSMRSIIGSNFRWAYGKEYKFDNYITHMVTKRGINRGVTIRYGKNLTSIQQDENCDNVVTGVYPYWIDTNSGTEEHRTIKKLPEKIVNVPGTFNFVKVIPYDLGERFQNEPTEDEMRSATNSYISENKLGEPKVSLDVSFAQLYKIGDYDNLASLERVELGDTVNIEFYSLGINSSARCVKTKYDVRNNMYIEVSLGDAKSNLANGISSANSQLQSQIANQYIKFDATIGSIKIAVADIEFAMIEKADIKYLESNFAKITNGFIDNAIIHNLTSKNIQAGGIQSSSLTIENGFIKDAMIDTINAGKINAGKINSNKVSIGNDDITIAESTMQFRDKNGKVRIQMGQDANGNFTFIIIGEDGTTTLMDSTGIKEGAITDGFIKNNMIGSGEIGGEKINISSMISEINKEDNADTIKGSKIRLDTEAQTLDMSFSSLKTKTDNLETITEANSTNIIVMEGNIQTAIENTKIVKDGNTVLLKDEFSKLDQSVSGLKSTVGKNVTDIEAMSNRVQSAETKIQQNTTDIILSATKAELDEKTSQSIGSIEVQYALSDSEIEAPTSGWSAVAPQWQSDKYMWSRTVSITLKGVTVTSNPTCISGAKGESYRVEIVSSNGAFFKNGNIDTILSAIVYNNTENITDSLNSSSFKWKKINADGTPDTEWNTQHAGGTKSVKITTIDVNSKASFICDINI